MLVVSVSLVLSGCATHNGDPATPGIENGLSSGSRDLSVDSSAVLWGYYDVHIDPRDFSVSVTPDRSAMFLCNVVNFINNKTPSALKVEIISKEENPDYLDLNVNIGITHPFPGFPSFNGYDVRGVFMGDGSESLGYNGELVYPVAGVDQTMPACSDTAAGRADGYTRWFNLAEFSTGGMPLFSYTQGDFATPGFAGTATLCPYKYFTDSLGPDDELWSWLNDHADLNGVFSSSASNTRNYSLRFPTEKILDFGYAIIGSWKGLEPVYHPANAPESPAVDVTVTDNLYYVDDANKGGNLIVDFSVFGWEYQPSTILIESTVLSGVHAFNPTDIETGTTPSYTSYSIMIPADNIQGTDDNEFWVIAEYSAFDYTNQFGVENQADTDPLAAFFRYDLEVSDTEPECPTPQILDISPKIVITGTFVDDAKIELNTVVPGPDLAANLVKSGQSQINGTDVQWVDDTTITADFDLSGAAIGYWDLVVTNGCGGMPGGCPGIFKVVQDFDPSVIDIGGLPDPQPTSGHDHLNFCVLGDNTNGNAGVYYFYAVGEPPPGDATYQVMKYPLDYSQNGECHFTLQDNYGYMINGLLGGPEWPAAIEVTSSGAAIFTSAYPDIIEWTSPVDGRGPVYWCKGDSNGLLTNGYTYFDSIFVDIETTFDCESSIYGYWGNDPGMGVDGATMKLASPYSTYDYGSYNNFFPVDHTGSVDGLVSDMESYKHAIDNDPQGIDDPYDMIFYYLEGYPDDPGIEVMKVAWGEMGESLCTIDDALVGVPVDISCLPTHDAIDGVETNWLYVLEDNGNESWQVAVFDQNGTLIDRMDTYAGTPIALDCDTVNIRVHVWTEIDGDIHYRIFGY